MTNITESIFDISQESYDELFERFEKNMSFKGYTIEEWNVALDLKDLPLSSMTLEDVERYNIKVTNQSQIIAKNYALASASYVGLRGSVERAMMIAKQTIINEIDEYNSTVANPASKKRYPASDKLEAEAYNRTLKLQMDYLIAEVFKEYWEVNWKKINLINSRLTSLSVGKNLEYKLQS